MGIAVKVIFFCQVFLCVRVRWQRGKETAMGIAPTLTDGLGSKVDEKKKKKEEVYSLGEEKRERESSERKKEFKT